MIFGVELGGKTVAVILQIISGYIQQYSPDKPWISVFLIKAGFFFFFFFLDLLLF